MESSILYLKNRSHLISLAKENQGKSETQKSEEDFAYLNSLKIGDCTKTGFFKLHFQLQNTGLEGLKSHNRRGIELAIHIENLIGNFKFFLTKQVLTTDLNLCQKDNFR